MKSSKSQRDFNQLAKVRLPKDYPWQVLRLLTDDLGDCLSETDRDYVLQVIRSRDFERYFSLSEAWSPQGITLNGYSASELFARYQVSSLLKKFQFPSDAKTRRASAIKKFLETEQVCKSFNASAKKFANLECETELACFTYAKRFLSNLLGEELPPHGVMTHWSRHGPGSNLDTKERQISLYDKYKNWPYSCTSGAREPAIAAIRADERWLGALEDDYRERFSVPKHVILDQDVFWSTVLHTVPGNRVTFVPKNARTDRSIAIEPCMNLYLQLGVDGYIRRRLKRWGVDLDSQVKNQEMARLGSLDVDDPYVTLDLASASDSVSLELCYWLLPPQWYRYLIRLRSPVGLLDDEVLTYEKISSMGNGYTFALESAIFTAICFAVEKHLRDYVDCDEFAVFGDDIIVRQSSSQLVIHMLNLFGFSLNLEKSFLVGRFRESCGADWYNGAPVRPISISSTPTNVKQLWTDINRIQRMLYLRRGSHVSKTTETLKKWIPECMKQFQGPFSDESFDSYLHVEYPTCTYRNGMWKFSSLVETTKERKGSNFLFRKLMHALRDTEPIPWFKARPRVGSNFKIPDVRSVILTKCNSPTSIWKDEYTESLGFYQSPF